MEKEVNNQNVNDIKESNSTKIFSQVRKTLGGFIFFVDFLNDYYIEQLDIGEALAKIGFKAEQSSTFLDEFWELVSSKSPFLISKIKRASLEAEPELTRLANDCNKYAEDSAESIQVNELASQINLGFRVRNKIGIINQMVDLINKHPNAKGSYLLEELIKLSDPAKSELILSRFGVERPNATLVELGESANNGQSLSRERVRLIVNQSIRTIYLAEKKAGRGPLSNLIKAAEAAAEPKSNAIVWMKSVTENAELQDVDPLGATYILSALGFDNVYRSKKIGFIYDPLMEKSDAEAAIDEFRRENKIQKIKEIPKSQRSKPVLISCSEKTKHKISLICAALKISRFDFVAEHATDAVIMSCEVKTPEWKQDGWVSMGLRIDTEQLEKINFACKSRKVNGKRVKRVALLYSILEHLALKFEYLIPKEKAA